MDAKNFGYIVYFYFDNKKKKKLLSHFYALSYPRLTPNRSGSTNHERLKLETCAHIHKYSCHNTKLH